MAKFGQQKCLTSSDDRRSNIPFPLRTMDPDLRNSKATFWDATNNVCFLLKRSLELANNRAKAYKRELLAYYRRYNIISLVNSWADD